MLGSAAHLALSIRILPWTCSNTAIKSLTVNRIRNNSWPKDSFVLFFFVFFIPRAVTIIFSTPTNPEPYLELAFEELAFAPLFLGESLTGS